MNHEDHMIYRRVTKSEANINLDERTLVTKTKSCRKTRKGRPEN
jgi:hypothetical protein